MPADDAGSSGLHVDAFSVPVQTRAPTGATSAYLVGHDDCLLIDPAGRTDSLDTVVAARDVAAIAVTHTHPDHVDAVAHYAAETGAAVLARRPDRFRKATGVDPDRRISEGSVVATGEGPVTVLDVPGHAPDHVAFELPAATDGDRGPAVVSGDLAVAEGSVVVGAPEGDLRGYLTALRRLLARNPRRLYPGHGPVVDDPRATLERLIRHRLDREERVLAAVRSGARDLDAVVDAAYEKDLSGVRDLARATVAAHLEKLAVEGKVDWAPEAERASPR